MDLRPVRGSEEPGYPRRSAAALDRVRRALAILGLGAASVGLLGGCGGARDAAPSPSTVQAAAAAEGRGKEAVRPPARDRRVEVCEPTLRLSGDRSPSNHFTCAPALSTSMPVHPGPPTITDGQLCQGSPTWARFDIPRPMRVRLTLVDQQIAVDLLAPDGQVVAGVGPGRPCVTLDLEPGVWVLRASALSTRGASARYFELWFEEVRAGP